MRTILFCLLACHVPSAWAANHDVQIKNFSFSPATLTVEIGDTVTWHQGDSISHTTTSGRPNQPDGNWGSAFLSLGQTFVHTFSGAGTFPYYCRPHPNMIGTIIVQAAAPQSPVVTIVAPAGNAVIAAPGSVTVTATATVAGSTIAMVEFFDGAAFLDMDHEAPFSIAATLAPGPHSLTARATAANGQSATSPAVTVTVDQPAASLTIASIRADGGSAVVALAGGGGPFVLQGKGAVSDPVWRTLTASAGRTITNPVSGPATLLRAADLASPGPLAFTVSLSGAAERPNPVTTTSGTGTGTLTLEGGTLQFDISYSGLSGPATLAHIHGSASAAESAGVLINLAPFNGGSFGVSGMLAGAVPLSPDQKATLLAGRAYVNIHTAANPSGEIRGQIAPRLFTAALSGAAERPNPVATPGAGSASLLLSGDQLTIVAGYSGLTSPGTAAHIHGPAGPDAAAGVMVNLAPLNGGAFGSGGTLAGTVTLAPAQLAALVDGLTYLNIHTATNPGGELRGQIYPASAATALGVTLSGAAERPDPVQTSAAGLGAFALEGDTLSFEIAYSGLTQPGTLAHIHGPASAGETAGVLIDLAPFNGGAFNTAGRLSGRVTLTAQQRAWLVQGMTYVNLHSGFKPGGEIRGQILP